LSSNDGAHVMLAVTDTGIGMDDATKARIFEPFFTTKDKSKGTGLGLSTVFGIVEQSQGHIWVYSEPGKGTTFKVYLPRVDARPDSTRTLSDAAPLNGNETILLVENESEVLSIANRILTRYGYRVMTAGDPETAIRMCRESPDHIDLLLTDVVMPKMSGPEVARQLVGLRPSLRVLYMSGFTDDSVVRHGLLESTVHFIQKPITPDLLARKVREVLGPSRGHA
jgi:CheY-like chemotaxis protein